MRIVNEKKHEEWHEARDKHSRRRRRKKSFALRFSFFSLFCIFSYLLSSLREIQTSRHFPREINNKRCRSKLLIKYDPYFVVNTQFSIFISECQLKPRVYVDEQIRSSRRRQRKRAILHGNEEAMGKIGKIRV